MPDRQGQRAGDNARQYQIAGDLVVIDGVTEERATEIAEFKAREVIAEYTVEAAPIAEARVGSFDSKLVAQLAGEDLLGVLGDPAFLVLLRKAQMSAASTEREGDHDILVRLLAERGQRSGRRVRASVDRAVQIIDHLDDGALQALTISWALVTLTPLSGAIGPGLDTMDRIFAEIGTDRLPAGTWWLDHLDTLDTIRSGSVSSDTLKKIREYLPPNVAGYVTPGFSLDVGNAIDIAVKEVAHGKGVEFVRHELKDDEIYRLPIPNLVSIERSLTENGYGSDEVQAVLSIASTQARVGEIDQVCVERLIEEIDRRQAFGALRTWWDEIPMAFALTDVGRAVALSNAKRLVADDLLPPLELGA